MMQSLFPTAAAGGRGGAPAAARPKPYVQFKAGKCRLERRAAGATEGEPASYLVTPEPQKGSLALVRGNDQLTHIQWSDRSSGAVVDDFIVFPEEAELSKVDTGVAKDRVYLLQWRGVERRLMFWMQDKDGSGDAELCKKFNDCMRSPPAPEGVPAAPTDPFLQFLSQSRATAASAAAAGGGAAPAAPTSIGGLDFSALLSGLMSQSQGAAGAPAATTPAPPAASSSSTSAADTSGVFSAQDFQSAMMGTNAGAATPAHSQQQQAGAAPLGLQEVLRADQVVASGVLSDPEVARNLLPLLPEGQQTVEHLNETVRSPQFQQSLDELTHAIQSDPSGAVMANLGLRVPAQGVNPYNPVGTFLDAVQAQHPVSQQTTSTTSSQQSQQQQQGVPETPTRPADGTGEGQDNAMDES